MSYLMHCHTCRRPLTELPCPCGAATPEHVNAFFRVPKDFLFPHRECKFCGAPLYDASEYCSVQCENHEPMLRFQ